MQLSPPTKSDSPVKVTQKFAERFIPNRATSNLQTFEKLQEDKQLINHTGSSDDHMAAYSELLKDQLFSHRRSKSHMFSYSNATGGKENKPFIGFAAEELYSPLKGQRKIPKSPYKVLDAPALQDDFYLNLVDWSCDNLLSVGLGSCVYLWNASTSKVNKLCDLGLSDSVTSVGWSSGGVHIAVGTSHGSIMLWDAATSKLIRSFRGHTGRVGTLAWNGQLLSSGSRDRSILHRDLRADDDFITKLTGHKQEVCGLKWSFDEQQLSSGGNDNKLILWNLQSASPVCKFQQHTAAVKALAWSPHRRGLLVSGGGTADRTIRYWNSLTGEHIASVDTGSQVCNLAFSRNSQELVSTHGYSLNQIVIWNQRGTQKVATLTGHTYRVLYLAMSPDGQTIVTGAGDETLRFWDVFPSTKSCENSATGNVMIPSVFDLR